MASAAPLNPLPLSFFNRNRRLLTRYQERRIRETFDFLGLPLELRTRIYDLCLDFDGVAAWFEKCYAKASKHKGNTSNPDKPKAFKAPRVYQKTPTVLLICRQTHLEAIGLLAKKEITFNHGLFATPWIDSIMSASLIRRVASITVTMQGHNVFTSKTSGMSWRGYMDMIADLAIVLRDHHKLKNLTIDFTDPNLAHHVIGCWNNGTPKCEYREHVKQAFDGLRDVRAIGNVTIKGIDPAYAAELKRLMESPRSPFLDLPGEIRNRIYEHALDYDSVSDQLTYAMTSWTDHKNTPFPFPKLRTPTILLLNRQVYKEARSILATKPLAITCPANPNIESQDEVPDLLRFISPQTIQSITSIHITVNSWEWIFSLVAIFRTLGEKHQLRFFHFTYYDYLKHKFMSDLTKAYPDNHLAICLAPLASIRGVDDVFFEGDLPDEYIEPMRHNMTSESTEGLWIPEAVRGDGTVVLLHRQE